MIQRAIGEEKQAEQMLSQALAINPGYNMMQTRIARSTLTNIYTQMKD